MTTMLLRRRTILMAVLFFSAWSIIGYVADAQNSPVAKTYALTIMTGDGLRHSFQVEVADNDAARAQGLMFRREMAADHGMLFDYGRTTDSVAMWMKNTFIPLDMLFIAADGRIVNIAERTIPHSETTIHANSSVRAVLELNGGTAARLKIKPGDRVIYKDMGSAG